VGLIRSELPEGWPESGGHLAMENYRSFPSCAAWVVNDRRDQALLVVNKATAWRTINSTATQPDNTLWDTSLSFYTGTNAGIKIKTVLPQVVECICTV